MYRGFPEGSCGRLETLLEFRLGLYLALAEAICTRLWALTSPSPEVSMGRKIISLNL